MRSYHWAQGQTTGVSCPTGMVRWEVRANGIRYKQPRGNCMNTPSLQFTHAGGWSPPKSLISPPPPKKNEMKKNIYICLFLFLKPTRGHYLKGYKKKTWKWGTYPQTLLVLLGHRKNNNYLLTESEVMPGHIKLLMLTLRYFSQRTW